jgi:hypothetical protein
LVVYYGNAVNPTTNFYFLTAEAGDVYTIDLSDAKYEYFRIEAVSSTDIDVLTINQAIETGNYLQNQVSYRDVNIPILIDLMNEFYDDGADTYYDFRQPTGVVGFVNDGNSTGPILAFISDSDLYQDPVTPNYKGESIFLYNIMSFEMTETVGGVPITLDSELAHNVRGLALGDKLAKIDDILNEDAAAKFDTEKKATPSTTGYLPCPSSKGPTASTRRRRLSSPRKITIYTKSLNSIMVPKSLTTST